MCAGPGKKALKLRSFSVRTGKLVRVEVHKLNDVPIGTNTFRRTLDFGYEPIEKFRPSRGLREILGAVKVLKKISDRVAKVLAVNEDTCSLRHDGFA